MAKTRAQTEFAVWLGNELDKRDWGVRTLARVMTPDDPEVARRALNRYLIDGSNPSDSYRTLIAEALNLPESELPDAPFPGGKKAA